MFVSQENVAPEPIRKATKQVKASKSSKKSSGKPAKKRALSDKSNTQPKKHKAKEQKVETSKSKKSSTKATTAKIQKNEPVMASVKKVVFSQTESIVTWISAGIL